MQHLTTNRKSSGCSLLYVSVPHTLTRISCTALISLHIILGCYKLSILYLYLTNQPPNSL
ncbi:hypothetical protein BDV38DRAFT_247879 [Aspergillus pseudotamarii]|uniref:Uncharacterized protein n=1 Tax=Aspergillus pseudotamarii TaxID=132259 RepID=A0A5N6SUF2_ASPPS|nr:uncharacterized protein BDV38DRAFT_247879 [Aspergillus pseudotamarii]KAE8137023.1 hypothetical protein BDV38DRAFT_247879 [Aspergillus pseudotamarii]